MILDTKKFNKEIKALKNVSLKDAGSSTGSGAGLNPLRKAQLKQALMQRISVENTAESSAGVGAKSFVAAEKRRSLVKYIISTAVGVSLIAGTAFAANTAQPGDPLFPVKKLKENIQIRFTTNEQARAKLQTEIAQDRLNALIKAETKESQPVMVTPSQTQIQTQIKIGAPELTPVPVFAPTEKPKNKGSDNSNNSGLASNPSQSPAAKEFSEAVDNLKKTEQDLQKKGDARAAASINSSILNLQLRSKDKNFEQRQQGQTEN